MVLVSFLKERGTISVNTAEEEPFVLKPEAAGMENLIKVFDAVEAGHLAIATPSDTKELAHQPVRVGVLLISKGSEGADLIARFRYAPPDQLEKLVSQDPEKLSPPQTIKETEPRYDELNVPNLTEEADFKVRVGSDGLEFILDTPLSGANGQIDRAAITALINNGNILTYSTAIPLAA